MLTAKAQRPLRLRTVSLGERSRLRPVNGTSAGRSLEANAHRIKQRPLWAAFKSSRDAIAGISTSGADRYASGELEDRYRLRTITPRV